MNEPLQLLLNRILLGNNDKSFSGKYLKPKSVIAKDLGGEADICKP